MISQCRLCGDEKPLSELIITLQSESQKVTLIDLIEYFCRVQIDKNPELPQNVCKICKVSLESFMYFCDTIEKCQKSLRTSNDIVSLKSERTKTKNVVIQETILKDESEFIINDADLLEHLFADENDEYLDSPASEDELESTTSASGSTCINLRNKMPPPIKPFSIFLERLEINFVKSDTESDSETEDEEDPLKPEKRPRASGSADRSPNAKRMRISPIKPSIKREKLAPPELIVKQSYWKDFKNYHKFFKAELSCDYNESSHNLPVPDTAKAPDGSLFDDYAEKFEPWSAIELKCSWKPCVKKFHSPYELLLHNRNYHENQSERFIKCSRCQLGDFTFSEFFKHVIDKHCRHLRYCCVMCSKMFYNFTALFHHYGNSHTGFTDIKMCLYDGLLFENYESLEKHVSVHAVKAKSARIKLEIEKPATIINNSSFDCETCGSNFPTFCHLDSHKKTEHSTKYSCDTCDLEFSSSYSLIAHENKKHC